MNNIINLKRLVELISQASGTSLAVADAFVRAFTAEVKEGLRNGNQVTIKGLGTFILSKGPEKNVYLEVDNDLAEKVNAPFAMFVNEELAPEVSQTDFDNPSRTLEILKSGQSDSEKRNADEVIVDAKRPIDNGNNSETLIEVHPDTIPSKEEETIESVEEEELAISINSTDGYVLEPDENTTPTTTIRDDNKEYSLVPEGEEIIILPIPEQPEEKETKSENISVPAKESLTLDEANEGSNSDSPQPFSEALQQAPSTPLPSTYYEDEETEEEYYIHDSKSSIPYLWIIWSIVIGFLIGLLVGFFLHEPIMKKFEPSLAEALIEEDDTEIDEVQIEEFEAIPDSISSVPSDSIGDTSTVAGEAQTIDSETSAATLQSDEEASNAPVYDVVTKSLTDLARKHYGEKDFWIYIYLENSDRIGDPSRVPKNTRVLIPPLEKYATSPSKEENLRVARNEIAKVLRKYNH